MIYSLFTASLTGIFQDWKQQPFKVKDMDYYAPGRKKKHLSIYVSNKKANVTIWDVLNLGKSE